MRVLLVLPWTRFSQKLQSALCSSGLSNTSLQNISNATMECGTYEQLGYWPNNFDDFAVSDADVFTFRTSLIEAAFTPNAIHAARAPSFSVLSM